MLILFLSLSLFFMWDCSSPTTLYIYFQRMIFILNIQVLHVLSKNIQKIGRRSESDICPSLSGWEGRSQVLCSPDQSMYHCLLTRDDYYLEACITAIYVEPGRSLIHPKKKSCVSLISSSCKCHRHAPDKINFSCINLI